ncbi:hypothetical protein [Pseudomonas sp. DWP3-1-2]|uniref:hypothetical protein n=1 Tax=Pseudomonas sp. DWP3-1-2 TaxID=2804645 RepID=UPI003CECDEE9
MSDRENADEVSLDATDSTSKVLTREALEGAEIASWKIKAHPYPIYPVDIMFGFMGFLTTIFYLYGEFHENESTREFITGVSSFGSLFVLYLYIGFRKKTVFSYIISESGGKVERWLDYSKYTGHIFKGIAIIFFFAVLTMISIDPGFIWMLAGPGAMGLAACSKLMKFENPIEHHSTKWSRYDLVFIDRKRKIVVPSYQNNTMAGFAIHVEKRKIDEVVALLKTLMPNAEFREEEWEWFY